MNTPLNICEARDVKGLYKKAHANLISSFTGVSQGYEVPQSPDLVVTTVDMSIQESTNRVIDFLEQHNVIPRNLREIEVVSVIFCTIYLFSFKFTVYDLIYCELQFLVRFPNYLFCQVEKRQQ